MSSGPLLERFTFLHFSICLTVFIVKTISEESFLTHQVRTVSKEQVELFREAVHDVSSIRLLLYKV